MSYHHLSGSEQSTHHNTDNQLPNPTRDISHLDSHIYVQISCHYTPTSQKRPIFTHYFSNMRTFAAETIIVTLSMGELFTFALTVFVGFFAVMNPLTKTPVFMSLTQGVSVEKQHRVARKAGLAAFIILVCFILLGKYIFFLFGLTIPSFKITGGVILFWVGFEMLQSKRSSIPNPREVNFDESISISPLAIPIISGPGAIITGMNFMAEADWIRIIIVVAMAALICYLNFLACWWSDVIMHFIGENIMVAIHKLMGMVLAILGCNMILDGIDVFMKNGLLGITLTS